MSDESSICWVSIASGARYPISVSPSFSVPYQALGMRRISKALIVTDSTVRSLHAATLSSALAPTKLSFIELSSGEANKTFSQVQRIIDKLIDENFHRDDTLIAFGGGVTGDISGLAANLYQRGMNFWQFPTTLLAQVDAAVGGKTAVNYAGEKNLIGTFYQPQLVMCHIGVLKTQSRREYVSAIPEIIKYALIGSKSLFTWIKNNLSGLLSRDELILQHLVTTCCQMKADIVADDELERSHHRALLNLGHTFAHALESLTNYEVYLHGEAVAFGLILASRISVALGYLDIDTCNEIELLFKKIGFSLTLLVEIDTSKLLSCMKRDKKIRDNALRLILLKDIGCAFIEVVPDDVDIKCIIEEALIQKE